MPERGENGGESAAHAAAAGEKEAEKSGGEIGEKGRGAEKARGDVPVRGTKERPFRAAPGEDGARNGRFEGG